MSDELWRDLEIGDLLVEADLAEREGEPELAQRFRSEATRLQQERSVDDEATP